MDNALNLVILLIFIVLLVYLIEKLLA